MRSADISGEIRAAVEDIDAGRPDTARQILAALLHTIDGKSAPLLTRATRRLRIPAPPCCPHPDLNDDFPEEATR